MATKIAVIGPADFIYNILSVAHFIEKIEIEPYVYNRPEETMELLKHLKPCDVVFFSGVLPFYISKEFLEQLPIPTLFLEQDEMAIATSLLSIFYHKGIPIERISIDLTDSSLVANILTDIGIDRAPLHVMDYADMLPSRFDTTQIINFHHSCFKLGLVDVSLTSIHTVYEQLQQLGVPVQRMIDPIRALIHGLQDAKALASLTKSHSAKVAVVCISLTVKQELQNQLLDVFARDIHASVQQIDETSFTLYSTRGNIEAVMESGNFPDFLLKWQNPIAVGFGYGTTATEAEQNAKVARSFAANHKGENCGYILTEDKELLGPFPKDNKALRLKNDHPELLHIAKKTKLSPVNLSKIIQFSKSRQLLQFTAADLSSYLQVTRRSTERILKKLVDHGFVKIVGEEMTYQQGRPRAIYELNIPIYR
jgi:hypothetical protein